MLIRQPFLQLFEETTWHQFAAVTQRKIVGANVPFHLVI